MFAFWTEHSVVPNWTTIHPMDRFPDSSEVSELKAGTTALTPCTKNGSYFVLRGVYQTWEEAIYARDRLNDKSWEDWLAEWKAERLAEWKAQNA